MKRLVIIGAGGHGKVVADCALRTNRFDKIEFLDNFVEVGSTVVEWQVAGKADDFVGFVDSNTQFFVAIGDNRIRQNWQISLKEAGCEMATLIHPNACVASHVSFGAGVLVLAGTVINIKTVIAEGCIINTGATVDHDCQIGAFAHLAPGTHLAGTITIEEKAFLGVGCAVIPGIRIGQNTTVGAGSTVIKDIPENSVAVGSPANVIKQKVRGAE